MLAMNVLYRHFKGGFYIVNGFAQLESEPNETDPMVVYTAIKDGKSYLRPLSEFDTDVSERPDNVTGQIHRFEAAVDITGLASFMSTSDLVTELEKRNDSPYEGLKKLEEDEDIVDVHYTLGKVVERLDSKNEKFEEVIPLTPNSFDTYTQAKKYAENRFPNVQATILRSIIKKCKE